MTRVREPHPLDGRPRAMKRYSSILLFVTAVAIALIYLYWPVASRVSGGPSGEFTVGTAILIAGYVLYPVLTFVAVALLVIALMLLVAGVMERRRV